jgi:hypothetical protein
VTSFLNKKDWGRRSAAIHKKVAPDAQIGDSLILGNSKVYDILDEADDYWIARWWPWHKYFWKPVLQWYIRTYCRLTGRKWVQQ